MVNIGNLAVFGVGSGFRATFVAIRLTRLIASIPSPFTENKTKVLYKRGDERYTGYYCCYGGTGNFTNGIYTASIHESLTWGGGRP